mgnify:CR=1 FL=1
MQIKNIILSSGSVTGTKDTTDHTNSSLTGGICGRIKNSTIENCTNKGEIEATNRAGGIVGYAVDIKTDSSNMAKEAKLIPAVDFDRF